MNTKTKNKPFTDLELKTAYIMFNEANIDWEFSRERLVDMKKQHKPSRDALSQIEDELKSLIYKQYYEYCIKYGIFEKDFEKFKTLDALSGKLESDKNKVRKEIQWKKLQKGIWDNQSLTYDDSVDGDEINNGRRKPKHIEFIIKKEL